MNEASLSAAPKPALPPGRSRPARLFHAGAAVILLVVMFLGFQRFYLQGRAFPDRPLTPPIKTLLIAHGVAMSAWLLLLLSQALLIVNRKHRVHMTMGKIGAVLAACIFVLGFKLGIEAVRVSPPDFRLWDLPYKQFMAVPIISITIFAAFVILGIWHRKRPEVHRSMMLLATLAALPAAADRIAPVTDLYRHTFWGNTFGPFFSTLVLGAVFLVAKWAITRSFDRYYAIGLAAMAVADALIMRFATTPAWDQIATFLLA